MSQLVGKFDYDSLKEGLQTCKHFILDSETQNGGQRVFSFARDKLEAHTLSRKLNIVYEKLKCALMLNVAFVFVLKNLEDGTCQNCYAHENSILMAQSMIVSTKKRFGIKQECVE